MATYKTPDVYVEEIAVFPPSVAEVGTAIPAFIGYTEKADVLAPNDRLLKPTVVRSLAQFEQYFGKPEPLDIGVDVEPNIPIKVAPPPLEHNLAYCMNMFFQNGGEKCYVVSVGSYQDDVDVADLRNGLQKVAEEDEPTLIVIPEAVLLNTNDYGQLVTAVLAQCALLKDRFGIFDVHEGGQELDANALLATRALFGNNNLKYGSAYYPFLKSTQNHQIKTDANNVPDWSNVQVTIGNAQAVALGTLETAQPPATATFNAVKAALKDHYVVLPPSAAVAGVYAATDAFRGVWKAPANVSLNGVVEPVLKLNNKTQEDFNVDATTGKSINALRAFAGKGTMVWGARTLAGNDNEWRYISVRRFFNMVEESVKKCTYWAVFEPNDANTWVKVRGMIENYLTDKWRDGALAGATTKEAFFVKCGLGTTMNSQDILEGRMNVEIGMAVVRPAEFIILKFSHKMQTS